jgi:hypothetical protein
MAWQANNERRKTPESSDNIKSNPRLPGLIQVSSFAGWTDPKTAIEMTIRATRSFTILY